MGSVVHRSQGMALAMVAMSVELLVDLASVRWP